MQEYNRKLNHKYGIYERDVQKSNLKINTNEENNLNISKDIIMGLNISICLKIKLNLNIIIIISKIVIIGLNIIMTNHKQKNQTLSLKSSAFSI